jgi:hypothetical protein
MYGVLLSVLLLQLFVVVVAPFAARVGYPLVMAVPSGVATTIYPGPVLIVATVAAGFAVTLATPRKILWYISGYSYSLESCWPHVCWSH